MSAQDPKVMMAKFIAAHQRGLITQMELELNVIKLIGISNDLSLLDLLPTSLQSKLLTESSAMSDQDIQAVFIIQCSTAIIEDMEAHRKESEAEHEACRNARRMIRERARQRQNAG